MSRHVCPGEACPRCNYMIGLAEDGPEPAGLEADLEAERDWADRERWW